MLSLNPKFLTGPTVDDLVNSGDLDEATGRIFRFGSEPLRFHRHQAQSIANADAPPDILLTNFMMAELLLTRQDPLDTKIIENANGLNFIVLDELHTHRGRQGADVAILVRRLRNRCTPDKAPICVGTSVTMASEGSDINRAEAVANVASRLFGTPIGPESVIDESLRRATDDRLKLDDVRRKLAPVLTPYFQRI